MPDMEERLMTFPGSGNAPSVVAAASRGRKAKVVKWYDAVLILYVCPLNVSDNSFGGACGLTKSRTIPR